VFIYAEPYYLPKPLYIPDDPASNDSIIPMRHYYLEKIKAFDAWEQEKGDTNIVIGIVDSGTDTDHPDLQENIYYNYYDPIDYVDNDNDGFIDNYRGWDLGTNDNDPQADAVLHGVHMSGSASATTNNGIGMSGVGFNCRFLPVKVANNEGQFVSAYEGIVYAADHGCDIINCSWGSIYNQGQYGQDIIDYATINQNALVIAACGNDNNDIPFYPASYNHVLSVAASNNNDIKSGLSSYGIFIDITAPGDSIYSTWNGGGYVFSHGTSSASSIISGCAAIVKSKFPSYDPFQIAERLRITADIIDTIPANLPYNGQLGKGRVNLFRAISDSPTPSIRVESFDITDVNGGNILTGDTIELSCDFINILDAAINLVINLESPGGEFQILNASFIAGNLGASAWISNSNQPFRMVVASTIPANDQIILKLNYSSNGYQDFEYINKYLNTDLIDIVTPKLTTTITSKGKLGFGDILNTKGQGFVYNNTGQSILFNGGLLVGVSPFRISDNVYNAFGGFNDEFIAVERAYEVISPLNSDIEVTGKFSDASAGVNNLDIEITHHEYAWNATGKDNFIIYEYTVHNTGMIQLSNLFVGLFADWDIGNPEMNYGAFDPGNKMGYTFTNNGISVYAGIKLLSNDPVYHYAFDFDGSGNSIALDDGFTDYEKYEILSGTETRDSAGYAPNGNNVANMVSSGPFSIQPGDSVKIAFALIAGNHLNDLQAGAIASANRYNDFPLIKDELMEMKTKVHLFQNYPNPATDITEITFYLPGSEYVRLVLNDVTGKEILFLAKKRYGEGLHKIDINTWQFIPGIYFYSLYT
ncbi:S8 family serine peptidase, partial [candidate division KSB1 bacterium]